MPHARNATSTTAANGFADHEPNAETTAVATGSESLPATTAAGSGCASVVATAFSITSAATASSAIQIARGTCRAGSFVSSAAPTHASKPMKTHPPTASAARRPAPTDPPDDASAPSVCVNSEKSCSRNTSRSASPIPSDATISAPIPTLTAFPRAPTPSAPTPAQTSTSTMPVTTTAFGVGSIPKSVNAQGAPRYATVVFATAYAQTAPQPVNQP